MGRNGLVKYSHEICHMPYGKTYSTSYAPDTQHVQMHVSNRTCEEEGTSNSLTQLCLIYTYIPDIFYI